jgi:alginate production protein
MGKQSKYQLKGSSSAGFITALSLVGLLIPFGAFYSPTMVQAEELKAAFERLQAGSRVEVELEFVADSVLRAESIKPAPKEGKDRLRGYVTSVRGPSQSWIEVMGVKVKLYEETITDFGKNPPTANDFKMGQRIYVKGRPREDYLKAKEVMTKDLKESDKLTGTITEKIWESKELFWIMILGKKISVDLKTDIASSSQEFKSEVYQRVIDIDESRPGLGLALGDVLFLSGGLELSASPQRNYSLQNDTLKDKLVQAGGILDLELAGDYSSHLESFVKTRWLVERPITREKLPPLVKTSQNVFRLREVWMLFKDIGNLPFGLKIGRQDFDEPREWLYDADLDAARLYAYFFNSWKLEFAWIKHIEPPSDKYKNTSDILFYSTWDTHRVLGGAIGSLFKENQLGVYFLRRLDPSTRNWEPRWLGLRMLGKTRGLVKLKYWSELAFLRGEDKGRKFQSYAWDLGTSLILDVLLQPTLTFGYALGSGDMTPKVSPNKSFEQTGYEDNFGRFNGVATFKYYGEIFDPELSNLRIFTAGVGVKPGQSWSVDLIYHNYRQVELASPLKDTDLYNQTPRLISKDLGYEFDLVWGIEKFKNFDAKIILSYFSPGEAFEVPGFIETSAAYRQRFQIEYNF